MKGYPTPESPSDRADQIARLETELRTLKSAVEELTVLNELAMAKGSSLEVDQVLDTTVNKSMTVLPD